MSNDPFDPVFAGQKEIERQQKLREDQLKAAAQARVKAEEARKEAAAAKAKAEHLEHVKELSFEYQKKIADFRSGSKKEEEKEGDQFFQLHKGFGLTGKVGDQVIDQTTGKKKEEKGLFSKQLAIGSGFAKKV